MTKGKKTAKELEAMIMQEVRKHPDWSDIQDVAAIPTVKTAEHHPNWQAAFTMAGHRVPPQKAFQFATELSNKFDLT
jgi:hypothetical protein